MRSRKRWLCTGCLAAALLTLPYVLLVARLDSSRLGWQMFPVIALRAALVPVALVVGASGLERRSRLILIGVTGGVWTAALAACRIYAGWFGTVPHPFVLHQARNLPEVTEQVIRQLVDVGTVAVLGSYLGAILVMSLAPAEPLMTRRRSGFIAILVLAAIPLHVAALHILWNRPGRIPATRLPIYDLNEAALRFGISDVWWGAARESWGRSRHPIVADDPGPLLGDTDPAPIRPRTPLNVILLQLESVDPWAVDAEVRGRPVMPSLRRFRDHSMWFDHAFAQHSGGGSADAELASLTGLMPLATHSGLLTASFERIHPLPQLLQQEGWTTVALHSNRSSFYNRNVTYPRLGFQHLVFEDQFEGPAAGWDARDRPFFEQSWATLNALPEPFFALLITMQSHGPFTNHRFVPEADPGPSRPRLERDYLQTMAEVDAAVGWLVTTLEASNLDSRTLLVVYSDHLSKVRDARVAGKEPIVLGFRLPGSLPERVNRIASHLDIAPTVVDAVGLPRPPGWIGSSLLRPGPGLAVFNDLVEIRLIEGRPTARRDERWMPFLLWSVVMLENRP